MPFCSTTSERAAGLGFHWELNCWGLYGILSFSDRVFFVIVASASLARACAATSREGWRAFIGQVRNWHQLVERSPRLRSWGECAQARQGSRAVVQEDIIGNVYFRSEGCALTFYLQAPTCPLILCACNVSDRYLQDWGTGCMECSAQAQMASQSSSPAARHHG
jgi:hypothetical protein